jgi:hypothetical protein
MDKIKFKKYFNIQINIDKRALITNIHYSSKNYEREINQIIDYLSIRQHIILLIKILKIIHT